MSIEGPERVEARARCALAEANLNAVRLALYQLTHDPELAAMKIAHSPLRGGAFFTYCLSDDDCRTVTEKTVAYLLSDPLTRDLSTPSKDEARQMIAMFCGQSPDQISDTRLAFDFEELAYEDYPRDVTWQNDHRPANVDQFKVVIIGAGISGIAMAIQLKRLGIPFVVIERQDDIGGTWRLNRYPEVRVDTTSYLYQFKFEKRYPWPEYFTSGAKTHEYLQKIVARHGILPHIQFGREVVDARWDDVRGQWDLDMTSEGGEKEHLSANVVVSASGLFSTPKIPKFEGMDRFKGKMFHTSDWKGGLDYRGKRVALIGNGSTGVQLAPALAREASHIVLFQRTADWIVPTANYRAPVSPDVHWLFDALPFYWNWYCYAVYITHLQLQDVQVYDPEWQATGGLVNERHSLFKTFLEGYISEQLSDRPDLIEKVTPKHLPMVRRLIVDNGYYAVIKQANAELVTTAIDTFTESGIRTVDGIERRFDLVVCATGFKPTQYFAPINYVGVGGRTLQDAWEKDGARAYLGMAIPGFPNLFSLYGPNAQPRAGGLYSFAEIWARYIGQAIVNLVENGGVSIDVREDVFEKYNHGVDSENKNIVWEAEGAGYYVNEHGRSAVNMPWNTYDYYRMTRTFNPLDFKIDRLEEFEHDV